MKLFSIQSHKPRISSTVASRRYGIARLPGGRLRRVRLMGNGLQALMMTWPAWKPTR